MNIRKTSMLAALGFSAVVSVVAYRVGRARADGVPTVSPLYYGGVLEDGGTPVEGMRNVTIRLWDAATAGTAACTTVAPGTAFAAGRFRVELDAACTGAVRANPNLWAEVLVDSTTFARTKLGAVPYALEAGRAAGASGPLEARIAAVEAASQARQVEVGGGAGMASYTCSGSCLPFATSEVLVAGSSITFTARSSAMYSLRTACSVTGGARLQWRAVTSPAPTSQINLSPEVDNYVSTTPGNENMLSRSSSGIAYSNTTAVNAEFIGRYIRGAVYTMQLYATITSVRSQGATTTFSTGSVRCGQVVLMQTE